MVINCSVYSERHIIISLMTCDIGIRLHNMYRTLLPLIEVAMPKCATKIINPAPKNNGNESIVFLFTYLTYYYG